MSRSYNQISLFGRKTSRSATDLKIQTNWNKCMLQISSFNIDPHHGKKTFSTNKTVNTIEMEVLQADCT